MSNNVYTSRQLVRVAKRENNKKRGYLVVNPLQGKHVPTDPAQALDMMKELGKLVKQAYPNEKLLAVGFAETATAIGAAVAAELSCYYMQTTREEVEDMTFLHFSEVHSHATCQKLVREDVEQVIYEIDRIVFVEDEVTTGNTILNIVDILEREFEGKVSFGVASLLNGMNEQALENYRKRNIPVQYLLKTNHEKYEEIAQSYKEDGEYKTNPESNASTHKELAELQVYNLFDYQNTRRIVEMDTYQRKCENLLHQISSLVPSAAEHILILGTEEFMYPPLYVARGLEQQGKRVRFHATTRSPIAVSRQKEYVLHTRYQLSSLYEEGRTTFVYDLDSYDFVLVITDTTQELNSSHQGVRDLLWALQEAGNKNVQFVCWRNKNA